MTCRLISFFAFCSQNSPFLIYIFFGLDYYLHTQTHTHHTHMCTFLIWYEEGNMDKWRRNLTHIKLWTVCMVLYLLPILALHTLISTYLNSNNHRHKIRTGNKIRRYLFKSTCLLITVCLWNFYYFPAGESPVYAQIPPLKVSLTICQCDSFLESSDH